MSTVVVSTPRNAKKRPNLTVRKASAKKQKKSKSKIPRSLIPKAGGPLGNTFSTVLSFAYSFVMTPEAVNGGLAHKYFRANGMFDPTHNDAATHQPHGFDQLALLYSSTVVTASSMEWTIFPQRSQITVPGGGASYIIPTTLLWTACLTKKSEPYSIPSGQKIATVMEQPGNKVRAFNEMSQPIVIKDRWSAKKKFSFTKTLADDTMQGSSIADPTEAEFFALILGPGDELNQIPATKCSVVINYACTWFNPKDLGASN
jgi:hypothetical protein